MIRQIHDGEKLKVREVIVVEGRDDTSAILRAVEGITIETHGFGIKKETWELLEKAYQEKGLILFTDPDFSGEEIRRKLTARFPDSKQAYLTRSESERKGDIGIENASPENIRRAIENAHYTRHCAHPLFAEEDLLEAGLIGTPQAREKREALGAALGIGYGNGKAFLKKLNQFGISREEFTEKLKGLEI